MDNLDKMDKFLEKYNFPKLNQEKEKIKKDKAWTRLIIKSINLIFPENVWNQ